MALIGNTFVAWSLLMLIFVIIMLLLWSMPNHGNQICAQYISQDVCQGCEPQPLHHISASMVSRQIVLYMGKLCVIAPEQLPTGIWQMALLIVKNVIQVDLASSCRYKQTAKQITVWFYLNWLFCHQLRLPSLMIRMLCYCPLTVFRDGHSGPRTVLPG